MSKYFVAFDIETTGLDCETCGIIEFGAVKFDAAGNVGEKFSKLANPKISIPAKIERLTGITNEMIRDAEPPYNVFQELISWCGESDIFFSHNAKFEARFIRALYAKQGVLPDIGFMCTYEIAKNRLASESYKLTVLIPDESGNRHRALPDALACVELYRKLAETYKSGKIPQKTYLKHVTRFKMQDDPTTRQLGYIESLGGRPDSVSTKREASAYIDELKEVGSKARPNEKKGSPALNGWFVLLVLFIIYLLVS